MLIRKCCLSLLIALCTLSVTAQQDKLITHFIYDKMSFNPGKTGMGLSNTICATTIYRNQWDKVNGAPNSAVLNIEADLSRFFPGGIGIAIYHDAIGFNRQNNVNLNYSYPIKIGKGTLGSTLREKKRATSKRPQARNRVKGARRATPRRDPIGIRPAAPKGDAARADG